MDCQSPSIRYTEFSKRIHDFIEEKNTPISGAIEITETCNMLCTHCYVPRIHREHEMSTEEVKKVLKEVADAGCLWLLITGGEPLLRPDFFEIYEYAKELGLLVTLFTNATLVTEDVARRLADLPPFSIEVSIYGASRETYERITRVTGSYDKCVNGIKLLKKYDLPLKLKTMALKSNFQEMEELKEFAKNLDLPFRFDPLINPTIDGSDAPFRERLTPEEVVDLESRDSERSSEWHKLYERYHGYTKSDYVYTCGAGRNYFHIDAHGKLNMCVLLRVPGYDLLRGSFLEGYETFEGIRKGKKACSNRCSDCKINIMCGSCPGWSLLESGSSDSPVDYLCTVAHLRAKRFGGNLK